MICVVGYDKDGIPRVFATDDFQQTAYAFCHKEAERYVRQRPDTGPLSEWQFNQESE